MNTVRLGIIGMGNIGKYHADYLLQKKVSRCELVAVCAARSPLDRYHPLKIFTDGEALIRSGEVDAVIVATPHFQHAKLGIAALEAGVHLMIEKPIAAHKADAERLLAAHRKNPGLVFGAMFQLRTEPRYQKIRTLIQSGELGEIVRTSWIMTDWFRTEAYYAGNAWRGSWKDDGGGVLLNQCLHNLDMLQWLVGMPRQVRGFCQLGRFHQIEVEDNVTAYLEWTTRATGVFVSSTGEAPGTNRFEIAGSRGRLVLENHQITFTRNTVDMLEFSRSARQGFVKPDAQPVAVPFENEANPHATLMQNFVNAILDGEPLIAPGADGLHSVELANAILFSSLLDQTVALPLDGAAYEKKLKQLIAASKLQKKMIEVETSDFASSFRK